MKEKIIELKTIAIIEANIISITKLEIVKLKS